MEARVESWFPTQTVVADAAQLLPAARDMFARTDFPSLDRKPSYRNGFTTYDDNPFARFVQHPSARDFFSVFEDVANAFGQSQGVDLNTHSACVSAVWINRLTKGGRHLRHVHGDSHMCGTMYVDAPSGASPIRFHSPVTTVMRFCALPTAAADNRATADYVDYEPAPGRLILWNGWLEHEVPLNAVDGNRDSISFNLVFKEKKNDRSSRLQHHRV
jgi:uncharacterized protein (TIGR02466 family)